MSNEQKREKLARISLIGNQNTRATVSWAEERYNSKDAAMTTGIKALDDAVIPMFGGQIIGVIGCKANGKTPFLTHLVRHSVSKFAKAKPRKDGKRPMAIWLKCEETTERAWLSLCASPDLPPMAVAAGYVEPKQVARVLSGPEYQGLPVGIIGRTSNRTGEYQLRGRAEKYTGVSVEELEDFIDTIENDANSPYYVGCVVADYLQATALDRQYQGKGLNDRDRIAILADKYFGLAQWCDAPVIVGAQANLHVVKAKPKGARRPELGEVWMTERFDHDLDIALSIYHPIKDGLIKHGPGFKGDYVRWAGKRIEVTADLFILTVLAWRDTDAPGLVIPLSAGGGATGRAFGDFVSIPWKDDPEAGQRRRERDSEGGYLPGD